MLLPLVLICLHFLKILKKVKSLQEMEMRERFSVEDHGSNKYSVEAHGSNAEH